MSPEWFAWLHGNQNTETLPERKHNHSSLKIPSAGEMLF
jgi:hypothetical protein